MTSAVLHDPRPVAGPPAPAPAAGRLRGLREGEDARSQFVRFVLAGGSANVVYAALFLALGSAGTQLANLVAVVASTALANELHRRLTFHAADRVGWAAAQWAGGGVAAAGLLASSVTLALLEGVTDGSGQLLQLAVVALVSAAIGLARFVTLRWVLTRRTA
ncbi:GtrA family protein [Modestobacter sp. I12A-02628]|uniref:GtrA family protein n=1 Tax=Goekera deserti TaxID=2497753 RepID=A0A7K3W8H1_9ACTN|nr:GtrA family protein [Goekera deserti]MPR00245.1 GtrA family protein [Goekera deserti]NDI49419.1 GtrA family protein [Goekera deserti]NEL52707.1 GtrA family protein [Goekera deserti]